MKAFHPNHTSSSLLVILGSMVVIFTSCSGNHSQGKATKAGPFTLEAQLQPDPPVEKGNSLVIQLRDESGKPVEGAELAIMAKMPAMGSMPGMNSAAMVASEGAGRYRAAFDLPMSGTWTLEVAIKATAGSATVRYSITVGSPGLNPIGAASGQHEGEGQSAAKPGESEEVTIEPIRRQKIGIRTGKVERRPLVVTIRSPGRVTYDETRLVDVTVKFGGWISKLLVNATGQHVRQGDVLFSLYSPDLVTTQEEYLLALRTRGEIDADGSPIWCRVLRRRFIYPGFFSADVFPRFPQHERNHGQGHDRIGPPPVKPLVHEESDQHGQRQVAALEGLHRVRSQRRTSQVLRQSEFRPAQGGHDPKGNEGEDHPGNAGSGSASRDQFLDRFVRDIDREDNEGDADHTEGLPFGFRVAMAGPLLCQTP